MAKSFNSYKFKEPPKNYVLCRDIIIISVLHDCLTSHIIQIKA